MPLPDAPDYSKRIYELLKETDLENLTYSQFQNVANKLFIEPENEDEMRRLVLIQLARMAVRGDWDGFLTGGGGGGGAPTDAEYVVMSLNGTLTDERVLTAGSRITISDGGSGGNVTIAADASPVTSLVAGTNITLSPVSGLGDVTVNAANSPVTSLVAGTNITLSPVSGLGDVTITAADPTGLAPNDASYLTLGLDGDLTNERVLTAGTGISFTDTGPNGTLTVESTGGGSSGIPSPTNQTTSQGLAVTAYWCLGLYGAQAMENQAYTTGTTGFVVKWSPPFTGSSSITMGINVAAASNVNFLWMYEESSTGWAGTFVGKIKMPTASTGLQTESQWLDATGSNITSPTFTQGTNYLAVLEIASDFTAASGRQAYNPFVIIGNAAAFTSPSAEFFNYQYTGTIDSSLPDSEINFFTSTVGWPMIGLAL